MHTIHDDNATTWRDLADQLTPEQVAELEYCERAQIPPGLAGPQGQLNCARAMARSNLVQAMFADIAAPADAIDEPSEWEDYDEGYGRMYAAGNWRVRDQLGARSANEVHIFGWQFTDLRIERSITADIDDEPMTAAEARQLASALLDAADKLDEVSR